MKQYKYILIILLTSFFQLASAQEILTLKDAIAISLQNNYDIKLISNEVQIAKNNVNLGNAGILPSLQGNYSKGRGDQNTEQTTSAGEIRKNDNVITTNRNYGVALDWTIFDGLRMFATYDKLKELQKLGEVNEKATVLRTIAQVISAYYDLVRQQQLVTATDSALDISRFRIRIAENKLQIGKGAKLDVLSATVDYNTDTSSYLQQKNLVENAMVNLNQVMARNLNIKVRAQERIDIEKDLIYTVLQSAAVKLNPTLQSAFLNKKIAELALKEVQGQRYPVIGLNSGYEFSKNTNPTGFNQKFKSQGFAYGVTASINVFNGFLQRQNERNAKISINSSQLDLERTEQAISADLLRAFQNYQTNLDLLKVEQGNVEIAKQNLDITLDKYKLGSIASIELREAQRNSIQAIVRFVDAQHQAKLTEISLKEISGTLNIQ